MCDTVLRVSPSRIKNNLAYIRSRIPPGTRILVNLKANAYGHGAYLTGPVVEEEADYAAVACREEGMRLRRDGFGLPLLVYNPPLEWDDEFFEAGLEPVLYSVEQAATLLGYLAARRRGPVKVHIQLDTGMHRSGLMPDRTEEMIALLRDNPLVRVVSVFSHLAAADDPAEDEFTRGQIRLFERLSSRFRVLNPDLIRHIANSAAVFRFPEAAFDMVRPGLAVYGISPVEGEPEKVLRPVGQLTNRVTQVRTIGPGETVGYNRRFRAERPVRVALIPVGYGDGYKRALGLGKGYVLIRQRRAPLIGVVNMDMITVDVTAVPGVEPGESAVLIGDDPSAAELARRAGTIPYDILASLTARVRREWGEF
ncbi:MAG: alanine racemase [Chlorobi bacterium]|nr:alanine racemase [Chlorobiota bacterium]